MNRPLPNPNPDLSGIIEMFEMLHDGHRVKDMPQHVYETLAQALYGEYYWEWRRGMKLYDE